jgi:hypothetical protein
MDLNRTPFAAVDCNGWQSLKIRYPWQPTLAALAAKLVFGVEII